MTWKLRIILFFENGGVILHEKTLCHRSIVNRNTGKLWHPCDESCPELFGELHLPLHMV